MIGSPVELPPELAVGKDHLSCCWCNVLELQEKGMLDIEPETEDSQFVEVLDANYEETEMALAAGETVAQETAQEDDHD